jgi:hypothetical protein
MDEIMKCPSILQVVPIKPLPVVGWTTHHCIVEFNGEWFLFHHDSVPSDGKTWLRSLKVVELLFNEDGTIKTIEGSQK